jgi:hypothetical protein
MKIFQLFQAAEWRPKIAHGKTVGFVVKTDQAPERGGRNARQSIFCRPIRGLDIFWTIQPTVLPWATFGRASGALVAVILFFVFGAAAAATNDLSDAEIQGRHLAQQLCEAQPAENFTNTGVLQIRDGKGKTSKIPIKFETIVTTTNWSSIYELSPRDFVTNTPIKLVVLHGSSNSNHYRLTFYFGGNPERQWTKDRSDFVVIFPFAGDFWVADLGLEFFHWPEQKILKHEMRRGRACKVLESTNPNLTSTNPVPPICYSRVVSWIDNESGGIVHAEAYDAQNKLLKEFDPKSFKKVNGQWELQEMEIRNVQTGSRTRLDFDLKKQ